MPTLDWIGKKAVLNHHREVPYRLLECDSRLSVGDTDTGNLLVQGDNLLALKALLPYYAGKVKCIYIDPPYNTGNEGWVYNDNVNSAEIRKWLGEVVGKEADDLSRHDKWLCMMYPRLMLLRDMLREDGALFISIDDNSIQSLRFILDEIFGTRNFITTIIWHKIYAPKGSAKHFSEDHDYVVVYALNGDLWRPNPMPRTEKQDRLYRNPDNDPRGLWRPNNLAARNKYSKGTYSITCPGGRIIPGPPKGSYWRISEEKLWQLHTEGRIWWGKNGNSVPAPKIYLSEVKQGIVPQTIWHWKDVGHTQEGKKELLAICDFDDSESVFITPKPTRLIKRILEIATDSSSIVFDSFAGSGTTAQAVLDLNRDDHGDRHFVLIEMDNKVCKEITQQRLTRVCSGQLTHRDEEKNDPLGGGFRYCTLGKPLFDESGNISDGVTFADLAAHIYFTETGTPIPRKAKKHSLLLGVHQGKAVYLLFNGIMGDHSPLGGNILTNDVLKRLPEHSGPRVIYGEGCRLSQQRLRREGIVFRQIPYEIRTA